MKNKKVKLCECGCGNFAKPGRRFITGHNLRILSPEQIIKKHVAISVGLTGRILSPEHIEAISVSLIGVPKSLEQNIANRAGQIKRYEDPKERKKISAALTGVPKSSEHKVAMKKVWEDPEYRENQLKAIFKGLNLKPNKPEKLLFKLLNKLFPKEWKYVGDGSLLIGYKNPDFVNNQNNKIIELFGDYWHGEKRTGKTKEINEQKRINLFAKYGYKTLIIWEYELEDLVKLGCKILKFNLV